MFTQTFNAETVFLVTEEPDWSDVPVCEFSLTRDRQASLTQREARRPYAASLLTKVSWTSTVSGTALRQLQSGLRALTTERVVLPLFPLQTDWAHRADALIQGGLMVVWREDWSNAEIYAAGSEPTWPGDDDLVAPALMGYLTKSEPVPQTPDCATFRVEFTESSPAEYALTPPNVLFDAGPTPAGYPAAPKLLPVAPDFTRIIEALRIVIDRFPLGFTREQSAQFYQQEVFRGQEADYALTGDQPATLLRFFLDYAAPGASFWAPNWIAAARLLGDVAEGDAILHVDDTSAVAVGEYLYLWADDSECVKITGLGTGLDGGPTITLEAGVHTRFPAEVTCLLPLSLVRLDDPVLRLAWTAPNLVTCTLAITEQRGEYTLASDETLGATQGRLPLRVYLYLFERDLGNGTTVTDRYTSFETDLTYGGHTWTSANFSHGDIPQSLNLEDDTVDLSSFIFTGNPLLDDAALRSEGPLMATIFAGDYDGTTVSAVVALFAGEITAPARDGDKLNAKLIAGFGDLDVQVPRLIHGLMCNHLTGANPDGSFLISFGCSLLRADWKFNAAVDTMDSAWPYQIALTGLARATGAAPTFYTDWFALGYLEWGAGEALQRRYILKSTLPVAGAVTLTLQKPFEGAGPAAADAVALYPGCDGTRAMCRPFDAGTNTTGKFDNYVNFGGEPFTPVGNPSLLKLSPTTAGGKK